MPEVRRLDDYPNILLVGGKSIYQTEEDYRGKLRDYLYGLSRRESPVRNGTHDFWITYPYPPLIGHGPNFSWEDMSVTPLPMRGIIEMSEVPIRQVMHEYQRTLQDEMHTLLQEVGHHWLVPHRLRFRVGSRVIAASETVPLVRRLNAGGFPDGPALLGRTNNHWSVFTDTQDSPLDGQSYKAGTERDGLPAWVATRRRHPEISVRGEDGGAGAFRMLSTFNDVELYLMGVLGQREVYADDNPQGRVKYIEPRVTSGYDYHVGLFVAYDDGKFDTFGFYGSHDHLAAVGFDGKKEELALGADYRPFTGPGVVMRVVRRGDELYFQAKYDTPYDDLEHERIHGLFDDLQSLPEKAATGGFARFRTVAHWQRTETPRAIGLIVARRGGSFLVEGRFYDLGLKKGDENGSQSLKLTSIPRVVRRFPNLHRVPVGILYHHKPVGSFARVSRNRLYLTAPHSTPSPSQPDGFKHYPHFDTRNDDDRSLKYFIVPEAGDFTFGSSVRITRVTPTPWAGGDIQGRTMWGEPKSIAGNQLLLPPGGQAKRGVPDNNAYRCAFILVAEDIDDIPEEVVRDLDVVRRYFAASWRAATRQERRIISTLGG